MLKGLKGDQFTNAYDTLVPQLLQEHPDNLDVLQLRIRYAEESAPPADIAGDKSKSKQHKLNQVLAGLDGVLAKIDLKALDSLYGREVDRDDPAGTHTYCHTKRCCER